MKEIIDTGKTVTLPSGRQGFNDANKVRVFDYWLNMAQEEIVNAIAAAGITPDNAQVNQLALAIQAIATSTAGTALNGYATQNYVLSQTTFTQTPNGIARTIVTKAREIISTSDHATFEDSIAAANARGVALRINSNVTLSASATLNKLQHDGGLVTVTGGTLTIGEVVDTQSRIFSLSGGAVLLSQGIARPEWFVANVTTTAGAIKTCVDSLPATGGIVKLENKTYAASGYINATGQRLTRDYITIEGARMPVENAGRTALENGTIILGAFGAEAALGLTFRNLGFDAGAAAADGFASTQCSGLQLENVIGLCQGPDVLFHGILFENCNNVNAKNIAAVGGVWGIAVKSQNTNIDGVRCVGNGYSNIIFKSDAPSTFGNVNATNLNLDNSMLTAGFGRRNIWVQGFTTNFDGLNVTNVNGTTCAGSSSVYLEQNHKNVTMDNLNLSANGLGSAGLEIRAGVGPVQIGNVTMSNFDVPIYGGTLGADCHVHICSATIDGLASTDLVRLDIARRFTIDFLNAHNHTYGAAYDIDIDTNSLLQVGNAELNPSMPIFRNSPPVLINGWTSLGGANPLFTCTLEDYGVRFKGIVGGGTAAAFCAIPVYLRSGNDERTISSANTTGTPAGTTFVSLAAGTTLSMTDSWPLSPLVWLNVDMFYKLRL